MQATIDELNYKVTQKDAEIAEINTGKEKMRDAMQKEINKLRETITKKDQAMETLQNKFNAEKKASNNKEDCIIDEEMESIECKRKMRKVGEAKHLFEAGWRILEGIEE